MTNWLKVWKFYIPNTAIGQKLHKYICILHFNELYIVCLMIWAPSTMVCVGLCTLGSVTGTDSL